MDTPHTGTLRRAPLDCDVIVGAFEEGLSQMGGSTERILLPDLSLCQLPLRMKINPADPLVKTSEEILTLQDASGKQAFRGVPGLLESNYIIVVEDSSTSPGENAVYQCLPVSHWVGFQRVSTLPQLTIEEQEELYDMLQKYGDRPSRASRAIERYKEKVKGSGKFQDEGGIVAGDNLEDSAGGFGGNYRTSMAASSRRKKASGGDGGGDDGPGFDGDDFDAAYDTLVGGGATRGAGADVEEDEFGDVGEADANVRARDGQGYDDDAQGVRGREFDVVGDEACGEEAAADLMVDYFADDAGDDGALLDEDGARGEHDWDADDVEQGGAAAMRGAMGEEELGVDLDSDALDGDDLAKAAAAAAAGPAKPIEDSKSKGKRGSCDLEGRAAKRGRFDEQSVESMREELVSFLRSQGGKATAAALSKAFGGYVKEEQAKKRFFGIVGELTKPVREIDQKLYFVLKK